MTRVLRFEAGNPRHVYYRMLIETAMQSRGAKASDSSYKPSKETRRAEARILDQLQAVSKVDDEALAPINAARAAQKMEPLEAPDDPHAPDPRPRTLASDGGTMSLQQTPEFALLVKYVEETPWQSGFSRLSVDLEDWLDAAEKVEDAEGKPVLQAVSGGKRNKARD